MMYTELYSFEGTSATDAGKTESTLEKAGHDSRKLFKKHFSVTAILGSIRQSLRPRTSEDGK